MTEKRFEKTTSTIEKYRIYDNDREDAYFITCDEHCIDTLVDLLNELNEERLYFKRELQKELVIQAVVNGKK